MYLAMIQARRKALLIHEFDHLDLTLEPVDPIGSIHARAA